ncbi:unnamed protein product [Mycena citricolor]|uniref:Regulatory P domain-containing protein n=1 Tax=Mycena citricolor TaxID=2018698 RepID=A0AAD2K514_9AGAR|nr:unnamed protein product [Mycena citricolor]
MALVSLLFLAAALAASRTSAQAAIRRGDEAPFMHVPLATATDYASGRVHKQLMAGMVQYVSTIRQDGVRAADAVDPLLGIAAIREYTPCVGGYGGTQENNTYACRNLDLYAFVPHGELGSAVKVGNDIWGWAHTDVQGATTREFGLVGQMDGTAFVEVLSDGQIAYLGRLATQTTSEIWRDIKVIGHHAYIGSEALGHGIQVFDLHKLLDKSLLASPKVFSIETDLTALYDGLPLGSSHNVVSHEDKNLIIAVGALPRTDICGAGLIFIDVSDPSKPTGVGCAGDDGYVHDAQCLTYIGPDARYNGSDICYAFNEDTFTIYDITNPADTVTLSVTYYYGVAYSHQGWVIDEKNQTHLLLNDELDELSQSGWAADQRTTTYIWDITDLERPVLTGHYKSPAVAIDHNLYVRNGLAYETNYNSGLRVVDVSSVKQDPTGAGFFEAAFFDVHPEDDETNGSAEIGGAWSSYPYFDSGYILVNTLERGLFVVKYNNTGGL